MTLLELVDPILERVCVLNRAGSYSTVSASRLSIQHVRSELVGMLDAAEEKAMKDPVLSGEYAKIKENLVVFVDNIIAGSDLPFRDVWRENRMADSYLKSPILNGEQGFFAAISHALEERSANVQERLLFYYVCLGLGFAEEGPLDPDDRRKLQTTLASRLRDRVQFDLSTRICPAAYEHVDTRDFTRTLRTPLRWTVVAATAALVAATAFAWYSVRERYEKLDSALRNLNGLTSDYLKPTVQAPSGLPGAKAQPALPATPSAASSAPSAGSAGEGTRR